MDNHQQFCTRGLVVHSIEREKKKIYDRLSKTEFRYTEGLQYLIIHQGHFGSDLESAMIHKDRSEGHIQSDPDKERK